MPPRSRKRANQNQNHSNQQTSYAEGDLDVNAHHLDPHFYNQQPPSDLQQPLIVRTPDELNLSVLQRHYPSVVHIHANAPYAVIYTFSAQSQTWEKSGCEGTLFLVQLASDATADERYAAIVLNRRGLDNFVVELKTEEDIQITEEYIILQGQPEPEDKADPGEPPSSAQVIYGLWIYSEADSSTAHTREYIGSTIIEFAQKAEASRAARVNHAADVASLSPSKHHFDEPPRWQQSPTNQEGSLRAMLGLHRDVDVGHGPTQVPQQFQAYGYPHQPHGHPGQQAFQYHDQQMHAYYQQQQMYQGRHGTHGGGVPPGGAYQWQAPR